MAAGNSALWAAVAPSSSGSLTIFTEDMDVARDRGALVNPGELLPWRQDSGDLRFLRPSRKKTCASHREQSDYEDRAKDHICPEPLVELAPIFRRLWLMLTRTHVDLPRNPKKSKTR